MAELPAPARDPIRIAQSVRHWATEVQALRRDLALAEQQLDRWLTLRAIADGAAIERDE